MHCQICKVGRKALRSYGNQIPVLQYRRPLPIHLLGSRSLGPGRRVGSTQSLPPSSAPPLSLPAPQVQAEWGHSGYHLAPYTAPFDTADSRKCCGSPLEVRSTMNG